jgi:MFS family permease
MGSPLSRVLGSWFLFSSAQWMFMVASGVAAYRHDGAGAVGVVAVARLVPALLAAPLAGSLVDRFDRARVVAGSCALATLAFGTGALVVSEDLSLGWLVAVTVVVSAVGSRRALPWRPCSRLWRGLRETWCAPRPCGARATTPGSCSEPGRAGSSSGSSAPTWCWPVRPGWRP